MEDIFDIAIIGSGLGGLVCANILAKEGYKVLVLEKNNKFGGNLQTFSRNKRIFDTGVHYIGGLGEGEPLYKIFDYLGIIKDLKIKRMNTAYDLISFDGDSNEYPFSQGKENFINNLIQFFPDEKETIENYWNLMEEYAQAFPLHNLNIQDFFLEKNINLMECKAEEVINSLTSNIKLRAVLSGLNFLYAGEANVTPFYIHALSVNSYSQSAWRCIRGSSQIAKLLVKELKKQGGTVLKNTEVKELYTENKQIKHLLTSDNKKIWAQHYISNIEAGKVLDMITGEPIKKSYQKRIKENKDTISSFSLFITLKPETIPYINSNYYHFKDKNKVWNSVDYKTEDWPENYMISFTPKSDNDLFAEEITVLTYMKYEEVKAWENTYNTAVHKNSRGEEYEEFKKQKTNLLLKEVEKKYPNIKEAVINIDISTPLTYRDYMGTSTGGMYGYVKEAENPLNSFLLPKTKIKNLLLTGQSIGLHGVYGVTMGAILTCAELVDKNSLIEKINNI